MQHDIQKKASQEAYGGSYQSIDTKLKQQDQERKVQKRTRDPDAGKDGELAQLRQAYLRQADNLWNMGFRGTEAMS
jgi:hypothetical protein